MDEPSVIRCAARPELCLTCWCPSDGAGVVLSPYTGSPTQQWLYDAIACSIFNVSTNLALTISARSLVVASAFTACDRQLWVYNESAAWLLCASVNLAVEVPNGRFAYRQIVKASNPSRRPEQRWQILPASDIPIAENLPKVLALNPWVCSTDFNTGVVVAGFHCSSAAAIDAVVEKLHRLACETKPDTIFVLGGQFGFRAPTQDYLAMYGAMERIGVEVHAIAGGRDWNHHEAVKSYHGQRVNLHSEKAIVVVSRNGRVVMGHDLGVDLKARGETTLR
jgi:hypothetical protein